ncbi:hypothetical protein P7H47_09045 [Enterococcus cecorum]|uniref:Uncharacterized protein n=1 Tax=Enterococcus cecorum TaxID=44008 RepID=A0AAW8TPP1_9ENTE|nr:hypothetical protein [Enterococcus cecorum]MDT2797381.1 hypothetical protein [Enterococcus cecorum]
MAIRNNVPYKPIEATGKSSETKKELTNETLYKKTAELYLKMLEHFPENTVGSAYSDEINALTNLYRALTEQPKD